MVQESTNSFDGGLISDLNPITTPPNVLTDALNATLLTFNGNELVLQNDMGNTKIEGAKLSDGFVPIGMKENGGILYIMSHNPVTNETEIGSFPSPKKTSTKSLIINKSINIDSAGSILNTNIQLTEKKLNSGDSFIIFLKSDLIKDLITSYANRNYYKFKLISIENGVETDITPTLSNQYKYESNNWIDTHYWFVPLNSTETIPINLDDYVTTKHIQRYKGRKGGKLYLKIETEDIDEFVIDNTTNKENNVLSPLFTIYPILKDNNSNNEVDGNYYLKFNLYIKALSKIKPDTIQIKLQIIDLTGTTSDLIPPITTIPVTFLNNETEKSINDIYLQIGDNTNYVVVYTISCKNSYYGIDFNNYTFSDIIDLSVDPSQWANSQNADFNFYDFDLFDFNVL